MIASLSPTSCLEVVRTGSRQAKKMLLEREDCPSALLEEAAKDKDPEIRIIAVKRKDFSAALLKEVANCHDLETKMAVLLHSRCPVETRTRLIMELESKSWWPEEKKHFLGLFLGAFGTRLGDDFWQQLSASRSSSIRSVVASQPSVPRAILRSLQGDKSFAVRKQARYKNPSLTEVEILNRLAQESGGWERSWLAEHPGLRNAEALERLAADEDGKVRLGVLNNPNVTQEILLSLLSDSVKSVRIKAANILARNEKKLDT